MENKLWLQASCIFYIILKSIKRAIFLPQERRGELRLLFLCLWTREGEDQGSELAGINRGKSLSHVQLFATLGLNTGVGSLSLLQGIFPTQGSNLGLLHCGWILYQLSHRGSPEKEMATHSSVLAWRIPGTGEPGGLSSMGPHRVGHDWCVLAAAANSLREGINFVNAAQRWFIIVCIPIHGSLHNIVMYNTMKFDYVYCLSLIVIF